MPGGCPAAGGCGDGAGGGALGCCTGGEALGCAVCAPANPVMVTSEAATHEAAKTEAEVFGIRAKEAGMAGE